MAIKKQITDNKGIITRYHKISGFEASTLGIRIHLLSFVNDSLRQEELAVEAENVEAAKHEEQVKNLQDQITALMEQNEDGSKNDEIREISDKVNELALDPEAPKYTESVKLHASEVSVEIPYFEPITIESLYEAITNGDSKLAGGTQV